MSKKKTDKVRPQVLKGFKDYSPPEMIARGKIIGKLVEVFELMGFLPLQTPSLEFASTLLGPHYSSDSLKELFGFEGPEEVPMALRYEFTVSLARYVAANPDLPLPFRRYQYGNAWRVDKPGPGRFREFMQFDIDIVGTQNLLADAEIIGAMVTTFEHLGVENFKVRYSNRKILNGLIEYAGIDAANGPDVMRIVDKLDKQGRAAVIAELGPGRTDQSGDKIPGLGLPDEQIEQIDSFLDIAEQKGGTAVEAVSGLLEGVEIARQGISELQSIEDHLQAMGIGSAKREIDLTIVRGLGYYTGPVFETILTDLPEYGSVFAGGRYDNLVSRFTGRQIPGVGASCGPDRLLAALIELKTLDLGRATSKVLVTVMDRDRLSDYLSILRSLREAGIAAEIFTGDTKNLTKQVKYGDKVGIPFAVIVGSDEFAAGTITVKNLAAGKARATEVAGREEWLKAEEFQKTIPQTELISYLKENLAEK